MKMKDLNPAEKATFPASFDDWIHQNGEFNGE